jgi:hypothetical protein
MLIRIVKLTFQPGKVDEFKRLFREERKAIAAFDGCSKVELLEDTGSDNILFTYSEWRDSEALEKYRQSDFFRMTWKRAKAFFAEKAEAWSVKKAIS